MIIALNNKCNLNKDEFLDYQKRLEQVTTIDELILCPSMTNIALCSGKNYEIGAQNVNKYEKGAHTGEISAEQLKSFGVKYCIVGHSERRQELNEVNTEINLKLKQLLNKNIIPILCIGETKEQRQSNQFKEILKEELLEAIKDIEEKNYSKIIIAYEPIWSIGTGIIPTNSEIEEVFNFIKTILPTNKILYGGSANESNIEELKQCQIIDGYLLGGLSLKPENLQKFINLSKN